MSEISHGGQLDKAISRFAGRKSDWLDLSTGINPNGYPIPELDPEIWSRLPDKAGWEATAAIAHEAYRAGVGAAISLAPGSQAHIQLLPWLFKPQAVAIVGFTYQEHGLCWRRAGHEVYVTDGLESAEATARIVIVVNPNNPDGRIWDREALAGLARRLASRGGILVVDEAYCEVTPNASVAGETGREGLVVLRSLGKFYGLAGIRFGVVLTSELLARRLEERLGPWAVSGPAQAVAAQALSDEKWRKQARKNLVTMREELETILLKSGHEIVGGTDLFVLSKQGKAHALWEHLGSQKILTRVFPGKADWMRFGMPADKRALRRLHKALVSFYG
ncbi:MAG: threonine-phosphate decarboxylase CobD [Rhizobiaceae bacterium]